MALPCPALPCPALPCPATPSHHARSTTFPEESATRDLGRGSLHADVGNRERGRRDLAPNVGAQGLALCPALPCPALPCHTITPHPLHNISRGVSDEGPGVGCFYHLRRQPRTRTSRPGPQRRGARPCALPLPHHHTTRSTTFPEESATRDLRRGSLHADVRGRTAGIPPCLSNPIISLFRPANICV